ncbi:MAG: hypothetical protein GX943_02620 [Candidatus Pacebacteria bacterium]|jgi:hypothetical protein|nr:hypothetical protein [Candidatus Paceibacterota bacterium]
MAKNDYLRDLLNEIKLRYQLGEDEFTETFHPLFINPQLEDGLDSQQLEFTLQVKIFELKKLIVLLEKISSKSSSEKSQWLVDHQEFFDQIGQLIIKHSNLSLIALKDNDNNSQLSLLLAEEIKKAVSLMNTIFFDDNLIDL